MARFAAELQIDKRLIEMSKRSCHRITRRREEEQVVGVAKILQTRKRIEFPVERREVDIGEKAGSGSAKRDALRGAQGLSLVFASKPHAVFEKSKEVVIWIDQLGKLCEKQLVVDGGKIVGDIAFREEQRRIRGSQKLGDLSLAAVEAEATQAISVRVRRKPGVEASAKQPVKEEINQAFFPRIDVQSTAPAAEVAVQRDGRPKRKGFARKGAVDAGEILEARAGEVIKISFVGGGKQSFAPGKERLGVETDGCFVEFGFAIKIAPVQFRAPPKIAIQRETACRVRLQSARILDLTRRNRQWLGDGNGRTRLGHQDDHRVAQVYRWRILAD